MGGHPPFRRSHHPTRTMSAPSNVAHRNPADGVRAARRQVRRAWAFIAAGFLAFALVCGSVGGAGYWYRGHATEKRAVCVEVVEGDRAFVRPAYQRNWTAIPPSSGGMSCASGTP